jgi:hypothetical protein
MGLVISCGYENNLIFPADVDGLIREHYLAFLCQSRRGVGPVIAVHDHDYTRTDAEYGKVKPQVFIRGSLVNYSPC